jgi:dipeptidase E
VTAATPVPTILAMGGGGFTMEPDNPALDELVLMLAGRPVPRILFLPTASGDAQVQVGRFHATFDDRPCETAVLSIFRLGETGGVPLRDLILSQDVVYVGGGSMRSMLAIWREYGLDAILGEAWRAGVVLAGLSAGAMCWFEGGVTTSTGVPEPVSGLGFLPGSLTVHADGDPTRLPVYEAAVRSGRLPGGWAADDGVGLLFRGERLERVVSSRPRARAQRVALDARGALERAPLAPELLTAAPRPERPVPADILEFRRAVRRGSMR